MGTCQPSKVRVVNTGNLRTASIIKYPQLPNLDSQFSIRPQQTPSQRTDRNQQNYRQQTTNQVPNKIQQYSITLNQIQQCPQTSETTTEMSLNFDDHVKPASAYLPNTCKDSAMVGLNKKKIYQSSHPPKY